MFFTTTARLYDHVVGVNFAQVLQAADDIRIASNALGTEVDSLNAYLEGTLFNPEVWDGAANQEYRVIQAKWDTAARQIEMHLGTLSRTVNEVAGHMADVENRATNTMTPH